MREGTAMSNPTIPDSVMAWDKSHRGRHGDVFFDGGKASIDGNAGFEDAHAAGGEGLQAHGMAKQSTLGGALKDLMGMLSGGLDSQRGGGELYTAQLTIDPEIARRIGSMMGTSGGTAYREGPFILVARPGEELAGDLSGLFGVLVNGAVSEGVFRDIRAQIQSVRPDVMVEFYRNAHRLVHAAHGRNPPPPRERHVPDEAEEESQQRDERDRSRQEHEEQERLDREHIERWQRENPGSDLPPPPREMISLF
jgi:hypothetical protein